MISEREALRETRQRVPLLPDLSSRMTSVGLMTSLLLLMSFFYVLALDNSPVLGGAWGQYTPVYEFYLIFTFVATAIAGVWVTPIDLPGATTKFLFWGTVWASITWAALSALEVVGAFPIFSQLSGPVRITQFVTITVFVAPVEEYLFRVVLPTRFGVLFGSVVFFAVFHVGAYSIQNGAAASTAVLLNNLIQAAILGGVLFAIYDFRLPVRNPVTGQKAKGDRLFGFGGCWGFHAAYDLVVFGAIGPFGLALAHLGLIPV